MEAFLQYLQSLDPLLIYLSLFAVAFIENVFPPSPSDMVVVFGGSLVGLGIVHFVPVLLWTTAGSTLGFVCMYKIGQWFGAQILEKRRPRFLKLEALHKVEGWFARFGYRIIIVNRFLAGTRAVVSFFAGMSGIHLARAAVLSAVSALAWNLLLETGGYYLGQNWSEVGFYLTRYSELVTGIIVVVGAGWGIRVLWQRRKLRRPRP